MYDKLYDETENVKVKFVGFMTDDVRYDFGIVYTNAFFGKPLVVCMQTGRSAVLCQEDVENVEHLQQLFKIDSDKEAVDLSEYFKYLLPHAVGGPEAE
ncbi:DUF3055 domain-containing protein [Priestia taiwanensis]|uniref:DUF3055 domain-containing protein n=1 Tax=Priestia taiwanensis TaxID=1347902 RepID=A0A917ASG1_9BACI|nr:DUF3055 domain-containing protein [Priestia taiwanensis]MBM7363008.1 hypothetical protein [Priestia taiwanensis]GGE66886.1 hypothetical protein GCM10007140_16300 [Priestia taiwanensis]